MPPFSGAGLGRSCPLRALGVGVFLLWAGQAIAQEPNAAPQCSAVSLTISLNAGEDFERRINGLTFKMRADAPNKQGWMFYLMNDAGRDFIYPVNPPLRFNPSQLLGPGYGINAQESLRLSWELRFLLSQDDYERIDPLLVNALWPYSAPNPDRAVEEYLSALAELRTGVLG